MEMTNCTICRRKPKLYFFTYFQYSLNELSKVLLILNCYDMHSYLPNLDSDMFWKEPHIGQNQNLFCQCEWFCCLLQIAEEDHSMQQIEKWNSLDICEQKRKKTAISSKIHFPYTNTAADVDTLGKGSKKKITFLVVFYY